MKLASRGYIRLSSVVSTNESKHVYLAAVFSILYCYSRRLEVYSEPHKVLFPTSSLKKPDIDRSESMLRKPTDHWPTPAAIVFQFQEIGSVPEISVIEGRRGREDEPGPRRRTIAKGMQSSEEQSVLSTSSLKRRQCVSFSGVTTSIFLSSLSLSLFLSFASSLGFSLGFSLPRYRSSFYINSRLYSAFGRLSPRAESRRGFLTLGWVDLIRVVTLTISYSLGQFLFDVWILRDSDVWEFKYLVV